MGEKGGEKRGMGGWGQLFHPFFIPFSLPHTPTVGTPASKCKLVLHNLTRKLNAFQPKQRGK